MAEKKLSDKESLLIIEQMIGRAKQEDRTSGMGWIIWGWLLFLASIAHFISIQAGRNYGNYIWNGFTVGAVVLIFMSAFPKRRKGAVRTYTAEMVDKFGNAFFLSLLVMVLGNIATKVNNTGANFGYLMLLYAFWMYIHGAAFRFRLLTAGAFINWAGAVVIFIWMKQLGSYVLLVHALCVLTGYIIPGYVAQRQFDNAAKNAESDE
jgi:hypothetical protein